MQQGRFRASGMVSDHHHTLYKGEFKSTAGGHFSQARAGHSSLAPKGRCPALRAISRRRQSSRVIMRTGTLVSTARMAFLHVRADTFFKFVQVLRGRSAIREYRLMDVFGRVLPDSTNDDVFALFVPF